mmetsp:Transcript_95050/g.212390  ORF Transcript_95050/g.212390 Transcript_95050/m.212390 type:complete len:625 (-) Transcript_95050:136-2010(-)
MLSPWCLFSVSVVSLLTGAVHSAESPLQAPPFAEAFQEKYQPPRQTEWQRALFKNVSERAAVLSRTAEPVLLEKFDSVDFREQLARCCPSFHGLSAQALLRALQEQVTDFEVASGFVAASPKKNIIPDSPGMSLEDGLRGSFFQNVWQDVILHNLTFDVVQKEVWRAVFTADGHSLEWVEWQQEGCSGMPIYKQTYRLKECMTDPMEGSIFRISRNGSMAIWEYWTRDKLQMRPQRGLSIQYLMNHSMVACPPSLPQYKETYTVDGLCHSKVEWNASKMWDVEDDAEMYSYGLKPFNVRGAPSTLAEASERGPYCLVNDLLIDQGSPIFGDISVVFSARRMQNTSLISAIDTGTYQTTCAGGHKGGGGPFSLHMNCSAYKPFEQLGTFNHFNHLFLVNDGFWNGTGALARRFARLEGGWGSREVPYKSLIQYWEAMPIGSLQYLSDVRFIIGNFRGLFGTTLGAYLQKWAKQRGWVLVWSLGLNLPENGMTNIGPILGSNLTFAGNQRLVDPEVAIQTTAAGGLPLGEVTFATFKSSWMKAEALQKNKSSILTTTWARHWQNLVDSLPAALRLSPLRAGACPRPPDAPECVGVNGEGRCICYSNAESLRKQPRRQPNVPLALIV